MFRICKAKLNEQHLGISSLFFKGPGKRLSLLHYPAQGSDGQTAPSCALHTHSPSVSSAVRGPPSPCWMAEPRLWNHSSVSTSAIANSWSTASTGPRCHLSIILPSFTTLQKSALHWPLTSKRSMLLPPTSSEKNNAIKRELDSSSILFAEQQLLIWKPFFPWVYAVPEQLLHFVLWIPFPSSWAPHCSNCPTSTHNQQLSLFNGSSPWEQAGVSASQLTSWVGLFFSRGLSCAL